MQYVQLGTHVLIVHKDGYHEIINFFFEEYAKMFVDQFD